MFRIGDTVVTMSAPGIFEVIAVEGELVTIQSKTGVQKIVLAQSLRTVAAPSA